MGEIVVGQHRVQPWTHSKLDDFVNCPKAFFHKSVLKLYPYVEGPAQAKGNYVHKAFELYVDGGTPLPTKTEYADDGKIISLNLIGHKPYLDRLINLPGEIYAEREIAIDKKGKPCNWFYPDVWHRGKIDFTNIYAVKRYARIVDYKTGKKREKFKQLIANAMWVFIMYPEVDTIDVCFYWTEDQSESKATYKREDIDKLWDQLIPDLIQYRDAFRTDLWQPRQSGLCAGWCPVEDCEFWKPKRK